MGDKKLNNIWLLSDPFMALSIRLDLIRLAKKSIRIQTFIWGEDEMSYFILDELKKAALRGVKVELIIDGWVGVDHPRLILELRNVTGVIKSKHYNPPTRVVFPSLIRIIRAASINAKRLNHRMHSKIFCVDGTWSILGGRNYESHYFGISKEIFFRDREVLVRGDISKGVDEVFEKFWNHRFSIATEKLLFTYDQNDRHRRFINKHSKIKIPTKRVFTADASFMPDFLKSYAQSNLVRWLLKNKKKTKSVSLFYDLPDQYTSRVKKQPQSSTTAMTDILSKAKNEIVLQTPYLIFGNQTLEMFKKMSQGTSSLQFKFVTNSYASNDNILAHILGTKDRDALRKLKNMTIFEYLKFPRKRLSNEPLSTPICDHAKTLIIDSGATYIGSSNFDPRSQNLNSEIGVLIESEQFADEVRKDINKSLVEGNFFIESKIMNGANQITFMQRLKNVYLTVCVEPNLPSIGRILFYPFQFIIPRRLKQLF